MNVLQTEAPSGQVYNVQTTTEGVLQVSVAPASAGGGSFTDSASVGINAGDPPAPVVLDLSNAPPAFSSVVVTGWCTISWINNESSNMEIDGAVTFEISLDSGVTWSSIGDPIGFSGANPSTSTFQQYFINVPFTTRTTGPATGNVQIRATIVDNTTGGTIVGGQLTAAGVFIA